jgi:hypothetical protein
VSRHYRPYLLSHASRFLLSFASQPVFEKGQAMHFQKTGFKKEVVYVVASCTTPHA